MRRERESTTARARAERDVATRDAVRTELRCVALRRVASLGEREKIATLDAREGEGKSNPPTPDLQEE